MQHLREARMPSRADPDTEGRGRHEGVHVMNRRAFASLPDSKYGECSCRSKAHRREVRDGGPPGGRAAPFTQGHAVHLRDRYR